MSGISWKWITCGAPAPFYARKKFCISKQVKKAHAKVCGLGQFIFYVNGKKAGDHELDPGWTNYRKLIQYVVFDVTDDLVQGENVIGAEVGNGWFIKTDEHYTFSLPEFMPPNPNPYQPYGKSLVLGLELTITYMDGAEETIHTDETFAVKEHPVVMSNVYGSETIDGRLRMDGWCTKEFDASGWKPAAAVSDEDTPAGKLVKQRQPAIRVIADYDGNYIRTLKEQETAERDIYDFGQNMSGILEFEACGKAGEQVRLYPAEKLGPDGDVDQMAKGWVNVDSCITYIIGKDHTWETCRMKFTYFAGRYVAVEKNGASVRNLKAYAVTSAWKTDGSFVCDDTRYNQIYQIIEKAVEANMLSVHTDCPTIERFAWQEPNHLMAPSIFYMKDGKKLWDKFLLDMRTEQHTADDHFFDYDGNKIYPGDGLIPSQCPCYIPNVIPVPGMGSFYDIIAWGSACILGAYWHYMFYGGRKVIEENYDAGIRYLEHLKRKTDARGFISHGLGDWGNPDKEYARENVETAFLYADAKILAYFAKILGRLDDQAVLESYTDQVKENYNKKLLVKHPKKGYWCYRIWEHKDEVFMTQAAEALPLYWGMVPKEKEGDVVRAFRDTLEQKQAFASGEAGLPYVIQTAGKYGMNETIAAFITRPEHPSYYAFVMDGLTTLGEYWESNPRSHCHDMMGHIIEWYYNGIAGIRMEEPGFGKIKICPYLPEGMSEFTCAYKSVKGEIRVHVKESEDEVLLETWTPNGVEKTVDIINLEFTGKKVNVRDCSRR